MSKRTRPEVLAGDGRISLWFPNAIEPSLRSFSEDSDIQMAVRKSGDEWAVFVDTAGAEPATQVARYHDEKAAHQALADTAMILAGQKPKDAFWYARWSAVLLLLGFIAAMELYFAYVKPEDLVAGGSAFSDTPTSYAGLPGGSALPSTSFAGGAAPSGGSTAKLPPFQGGYGALPSGPGPGSAAAAGEPNGPAHTKQPGGLSAFGLDDRSPPGKPGQQNNPMFNLDNKK